jgi:uncharacterized membrane protein YbjE (DUF340 family)
VAFNPYLYLAFGIGFAIGQFVEAPPVWVRRASTATVFVLLGLLGASLDAIPAGALLATIPIGLAFCLLILLLTGLLFLALPKRNATAAGSSGPPAAGSGGAWTGLLFLAALVVGYGIGPALHLPVDAAIGWVLCALVGLVALGVHFRRETLARTARPLAAAVGGALAAATLWAVVRPGDGAVPFAAAFAFGWYSLAGPLVAARAGALLGLFAFLANFLREDLTMLLSPILGRRWGGDGLSAVGGATSMDTTLYFIARYGEPDSAAVAVATGLVLTVVASLLVPAVLSV